VDALSVDRPGTKDSAMPKTPRAALFLLVASVALGCESNSPLAESAVGRDGGVEDPTTLAAGGTTGSAGATSADGGTTGTAGTVSAAATSGGTTGSMGFDSGLGPTDEAGAGGGPDIMEVEAACPMKAQQANAATPFSTEDFCAVYAAVCGSVPGAFTYDGCIATYSSWATQKVMSPATVAVQSCASYHLCNAILSGGAGARVHCPHASGKGPCTPFVN
jgi:hypothetical protein